jgi:preprotein translocase subunit SecA
MYKKLAGMTGTAMTEANEFSHIYKLDTVLIPTNRPLIRVNHPDIIYKTEKEKFNAVCNEIEELYKKGRPILVGTITIEKSERLSSTLKRRDIPHNVLNAKYHEMEATIVAQAGRLNGVTIATNMAGRGTDILLGGNPDYMVNDWLKAKGMGRAPYPSEASGSGPKDVSQEEREKWFSEAKEKVKEEHEKVVSLDGLHIIGTERHESRRIDNQLRGRSGRQGDPGSSRFYISLEDDLMRLFGSDRISSIYNRLGIEEGQDIQHPLISRAIEVAQKRVEQHNFDIRKHVLEYDNVMNKQREVIYEERKKILMGENVREHIYEIIEEVLDDAIIMYMNPEVHKADWKYAEFNEWLWSKFNIKIQNIEEMVEGKDAEGILDYLVEIIKSAYMDKEKNMPQGLMAYLEKMIMLQVIDTKWKDHLYAMDNLREGIGLRAYGQRDPLVEYQHEGYDMFMAMIESVKHETIEFLFKVQAVREEGPIRGVFQSLPQEFVKTDAAPMSKISVPQARRGEEFQEEFTEDPVPQGYGAGRPSAEQYKRSEPKVGRNDPCPCGKLDPKTGKPFKYKKCCYPK